MSTPLESSIRDLKGVGPKLGALLARKGISTFEDALYFLPRTYEDRRSLTPMNRLPPGKTVTVFGKVVTSRYIRRGRQGSFEAVLADSTGRVRLTWFHAYPSLADEFSDGSYFIVYGEVKLLPGGPSIAHPEYEKLKDFQEGGKPPVSYHFGRVVPVYSETEGLHQKMLRKIVAEALKASLPHLDEPLPEWLRERFDLPPLRESIVQLHYPKVLPEEGKLPPAAHRLIFEEFFVLQLGLGFKKKERAKAAAASMPDRNGTIAMFRTLLPFNLTGDQERAIAEIQGDIARSTPMTRLVQGDVGAGKTVVALAAAAVAAGNLFQTAIMAPTEILASQHFTAAERWLKPLGVRVRLLAAGTQGKKAVKGDIAVGDADVIVGTHAIFQQGVKFARLGLVVVDEQHRFGVQQRGELLRKGEGKIPHLLMMTATPIPRTLALTLYGDLDLTVIREKPAGRLPIVTSILRDRDRPQLYKKIREVMAREEQIYIIYPLVEASEKLDLKSATEMHDRLSKEVFPGVPVALLHGRMKGEEKDRVLAEFREGKSRILISTTVIEVGIDVPNATLMVIEHPERLGLSQLHQLRGRVGRGGKSSECVLVAEGAATPRLQVMTATEDGFEIAEEDLKIRGPGEFLGTRQSGLPGFRVGHIVRDAWLLARAREEAHRILETDPELSLPENVRIREMVESRWREKIERLRGG